MGECPNMEWPLLKLFCVNFYVPVQQHWCLLVNNVMPPKKMQYEIIHQPTTSAMWDISHSNKRMWLAAFCLLWYKEEKAIIDDSWIFSWTRTLPDLIVREFAVSNKDCPHYQTESILGNAPDSRRWYGFKIASEPTWEAESMPPDCSTCCFVLRYNSNKCANFCFWISVAQDDCWASENFLHKCNWSTVLQC